MHPFTAAIKTCGQWQFAYIFCMKGQFKRSGRPHPISCGKAIRPPSALCLFLRFASLILRIVLVLLVLPVVLRPAAFPARSVAEVPGTGT